MGRASYEILLGADLLSDLPTILDEHAPANRYAVVTDSNVKDLYATRIQRLLGGAPKCELFSFPAGESNKTRGTWASVTDQMLSLGFGRDCAVIALGGGVTGDIAGFVASTYLRGVPCVQIPTSLLAMIDSSIGGKTGVDTKHGKNLVGTFSQPAVVVIDASTLETLPDAHISAAMAEALKHGAIADVEYFEWIVLEHARILNRQADSMIEVVRRSVKIKADVVAEDETEQSKRAVLNFGHTAGHAFETATGYELLHGEALAIGMMAEIDLGIRLGITDPKTSALMRAGINSLKLPTRPRNSIASTTLFEAMSVDKKSRGGSVRFSLIKRIGEIARDPSGDWTHEAPKKEILAALESVM